MLNFIIVVLLIVFGGFIYEVSENKGIFTKKFVVTLVIVSTLLSLSIVFRARELQNALDSTPKSIEILDVWEGGVDLSIGGEVHTYNYIPK